METAQRSHRTLREAIERLSGVRTPCDVDPEPFVSENRHERLEAESACRACPVMDLCSSYADAAGERWHVWGGQDRTI